MTIRCPHCGSPVRIRGNSWECGWCRDYGPISSLRPSERAKLAQATAPSIRFTFTVTDTSQDEESPSSFSRAELEDMVRRWDFSKNEWICRDLLIAAFPEAVSRWTAEELEDMETPDLLSKTGEKDPKAAISMMRLLLDTVGEKLKDPEVAQQLLGWDMEDLLQDQFVQSQLMQMLKSDDGLARQLFQSAYVGRAQETLLEACDWFGEPELKEKLLGLLKENPYFKGFD